MNIKRHLKSGFAFLLIATFLCSTISFQVTSHYCGKVLISKSIGNKTSNCISLYQIKDSNGGFCFSKNCCSTGKLQIKGQQEVLEKQELNSEIQFNAVVISVKHYAKPIANKSKRYIYDVPFQPPPDNKLRLHLLHESFLI